MTDAAHMLPAVNCPRCGYDQRGVVATWEESCPLTGTCTECGLEFEWGPVIAPGLFEPKWCVEYAEARWAFLRNCWRTFWRSLWPWRFWSRLQMSHDIHWKRLIAYIAVFLIAPLLILYVIEQATVAVLVRANIRQQVLQVQAREIASIPGMQAYVQQPNFQNLPEQSQQSTLQYIMRMEKATPGKVEINQPYAVAIAEAVFLPLAQTSYGTIDDNITVRSYISPAGLHSWLYRNPPNTLVAIVTSSVATTGAFLVGLGLNLLLAVVLPVGFVFLPASRKRAKVRWRHVVRVLVYGLPWFAVVFLIGLILVALAPLTGPASNVLLFAAGALGTVGMLLILNIWWAVAIKRYLKMPHGWAIAPLLTLVAVLLPTTVMFNFGTMSAGSAIALMLIAVAVGGGISFILLAEHRLNRRKAASEPSR